MPETPQSQVYWPGKRLGRPEKGSGSVARFGRRVGAIAIDWGLSYLISYAFFRPDPFGFATLAVFVTIQIVFVLTLGGSIGHVALGMRVISARGGYLAPWKPFVRGILIAVVLPAVIWDKDQRGMHDRAIDAILIRK